MEESHHDQHHVHFDATVINDELHDNTIIYQVAPGGRSLMIHLGFLQIKHRYRIELNIPAYALIEAGLKIGTNSSYEVDESMPLNVNCRLLEFPTTPIEKDDKSYYCAKIEFFPHKEKLLREHISVCGKEDPCVKIHLVFVARVLGRGKGTPMLRDGIHLIGVEDDEESELSDWQGFPTKSEQ
ncbi:adipose-secreted signaling protein [Topomyia yanbarensis]|uniref:adipose-secreted signaling protein n=1 Tax=Topomyia yanbarensis TaxID=2498891 RepID=UPI00273C010D|nr:adipose-secreted signaling protein [Topomyia yanbarensis]XP_058826182.1 adipose-secreted signaling protein [Topomyia yanbarensis]